MSRDKNCFRSLQKQKNIVVDKVKKVIFEGSKKWVVVGTSVT